MGVKENCVCVNYPAEIHLSVWGVFAYPGTWPPHWKQRF